MGHHRFVWCSCALVLIVAATMLVGCNAEHVGNRCSPEDRARATEVVWRRDGLPAYAGQALMLTSCGGGSGFCHTEGADGADRFGVPRGFDFDPILIDETSYETDGRLRLRHAQVAIFNERETIYSSVVNGTMPPGVAGGRAEHAKYARYDASGNATELPGLDSAEGRETLRNWLACGVPVIERTAGLGTDTACASDRDCLYTGRCNLSARTCVPVGVIEPYRDVVVEETWTSIYDILIGLRCNARACHGDPTHAGNLDTSTAERAYSELLRTDVPPPDLARYPARDPVVDPECSDRGAVRVVPGDPGASFLVQKIELRDNLCGAPMPENGRQLPSTQRDAVRRWITAGAMP